MTNVYRLLCTVAVVLAGCDDNSDILLNVDSIAVSTPEDTPIAGRVPARSNRVLTITVVTPPSHGTLVTGADGAFEYTPEPEYSGPDMIALMFESGTKSETGTVNITVTPVNDLPVAGADSFAAGAAESIEIAHSTLLANDTDIDSPVLTVASVGAAANGTVTMVGSNVTFRPATTFQGVATFTYLVSDGEATAEGSVQVTVGANNAPVATDDAATTMEDAALVVNSTTLLANDTDADQNTLAITSVSDASIGAVALANGIVTFTPPANYHGPASFSYVVSDGVAGDTATVTIDVQAVDDPPIASADAATTNEDEPLAIPSAVLLANDTDVDGDGLTITAVTNAFNGTVALVGGMVTFTPGANFSGPAGFDYTVSDGTTVAIAHVTINVLAINDPPLAVDDVVAGAEDVPTLVAAATLLTNDTDVEGDPLSVLSVGGAVNGTVTFVAGGVQFVTAPNYFGPASFEYTVTDGMATSVATVALMIAPVNDAPTAVADAATTNEDTPVVVAPLPNDFDIDGDLLSVMSVGTPGHGMATAAGDLITYTPTANYVGLDSVAYTVRDPSGAISVGTISITVLPLPDPPTAVDDAVTVAEDGTILISVLANDFDVDGEPVTLVSAGMAAHGATAIVGNQVRYTPAANFTGTDAFQYTIADPGSAQDTATVVVTVTPVNDPPVGVADFYDADDETDLVVPAAMGVLANDTDPDSTALTAILVTGPDEGTLTLNSDGSFTYQPDTCAETDQFTYVVSDGVATSAPTTVTFSINHAPSGNYDFYYMGEGATLDADATCSTQDWGVLCNDEDVDGDPIFATLASPPSNAAVFAFQTSGAFTYTPALMFSGYDSFTYTVSDGVLTQVVFVEIYVFCTSCSVGSPRGATFGPRAQTVTAQPAVGTSNGAIYDGPKCCLFEGKGDDYIDYCPIEQ